MNQSAYGKILLDYQKPRGGWGLQKYTEIDSTDKENIPHYTLVW